MISCLVPYNWFKQLPTCLEAHLTLFLNVNMQTGSGKTAAFLLPIIHRMIETDADAGAGPQCIVVTPTRFDFLQCLEMHHIAHFLGFTPFNGLILEPMCENNSLYLDDGEPFLSSSIQTLKQASVGNFCLLSESWWSIRLVSDVCCQGAGDPDPQRGAEVCPRLDDQERGGLRRHQRLLPSQSAAEGLQHPGRNSWQVIFKLYSIHCYL